MQRDDVINSRFQVEVARSHPDESFGLRMAASRTHNLTGYVITAIAPTGPASAAGLKVGWHITAINDINLERMNEKELGTTLALNTKTAVAIKFGLTPNDKLLKQVLADKANLPVVSIVPAQATDGVRKTTLTRGPNGSFGVRHPTPDILPLQPPCLSAGIGRPRYPNLPPFPDRKSVV